VEFPLHILLVPIVILELFVLALALAFLLASIYVRFRDIEHIWSVVMQGAFYATPIIYPITMVAAVSPVAAKVLLLNPVAQIIQDMRQLVVLDTTDTVWTYINNPAIQIIPIVIIIVAIVLAVIVFNKNSKKFAESI
jgi:ABC-2 type transport system permease protein